MTVGKAVVNSNPDEVAMNTGWPNWPTDGPAVTKCDVRSLGLISCACGSRIKCDVVDGFTACVRFGLCDNVIDCSAIDGVVWIEKQTRVRKLSNSLACDW